MNDRVRLLFHELIDLPDADRQRIISEREIADDIRVELQSLLSFGSLDVGRLTSCVSGSAEEVLNVVADRDVPACGPYRLVQLLGRGGMGVVYLGARTDGEIQQTVAVKLLNPDGHRPRWRDRFLKERQLLASLNHPSIVHVIDAGHTGDGRPYLVMEYVEGIAIDLYAAAMDVRERLMLFLRVCEGVSHAHRRLIIHCDLKPSNILVDKSGQPKLLDFGIAKLLDGTGDATRTVDGLLTPYYASPEQLRGATQTTATDIYSLGAVLYKMLTGRSPYESDARTLQVVDVITGIRHIPAPSSVNRRLPGDLDYILGKSLRMEPEERYASVDAFAGDIRALLEFRPIEARSGDAWYRTRKFMRRYRVPVVAAMFVIASLSAGLYIANRQRLVAEQRFGQLRQLSNQVFDLDKAIRDLPGSTEARQSLVSLSLRYLEGLADAAQGDLDLAREIGQGYWRVGRIQGVPNELNLGQRTQAEASLKTAADFAGRVLAARPTDRDALYLAAFIANDRMILALDEHRRPEALAHARESARLLDAFLSLGNASEGERIEAARRFGNIAFADLKMRRYAEAIPYARREAELNESLPSARGPINASLVSQLDALRHGDLEGAVEAMEEQRKAVEKGVYPSEIMRTNELHGTLIAEGLTLAGDGEVNLGRPAEAIAVLQEALDVDERLARKDSADAGSRVRAAKAGIVLAGILRHQDPQRALAAYDAALLRLSEINDSLPAQRDQALALANSSYPLRSLGRPSEARQRIDAALAILRDTKDYPADRYYFDTVTYAVLRAAADHEADADDPLRAIGTYEQLLNNVMTADAALPDFEDAPRLSGLYDALSRLYRRTGRTAMADSIRLRRVELWRHWDRTFPNNPFVRKEIEAASR
jgi:tetratricopeptide (TPR) repeat protein